MQSVGLIFAGLERRPDSAVAIRRLLAANGLPLRPFGGSLAATGRDRGEGAAAKAEAAAGSFADGAVVEHECALLRESSDRRGLRTLR